MITLYICLAIIKSLYFSQKGQKNCQIQNQKAKVIREAIKPSTKEARSIWRSLVRCSRKLPSTQCEAERLGPSLQPLSSA